MQCAWACIFKIGHFIIKWQFPYKGSQKFENKLSQGNPCMHACIGMIICKSIWKGPYAGCRKAICSMHACIRIMIVSQSRNELYNLQGNPFHASGKSAILQPWAIHRDFIHRESAAGNPSGFHASGDGQKWLSQSNPWGNYTNLSGIHSTQIANLHPAGVHINWPFLAFSESQLLWSYRRTQDFLVWPKKRAPNRRSR